MPPSHAFKTALLLGAIGLAAGCKPAPTPVTPPSDPIAEAKAAQTAPAPGPKLALSINQMMVMIVDRPGEMLWDVEKPGRAPKGNEAWYQLESHAVDVMAAGALIQLGGTGPQDGAWSASPDWRTKANAMIDAAASARAAAQSQNLPALISANGQIVAACEACHKQFKPDLPTGGMFMHTRPAPPAKT